MYVLLTVFIFIAAILLILIVLVQNSKGGGLVSNFSSSNQYMGVRKTTDFLEKATWSIAIALLVFSVAASLSINRMTDDPNRSVIQDQIDNAMDPGAVQNFPTTLPEENTDQNNK